MKSEKIDVPKIEKIGEKEIMQEVYQLGVELESTKYGCAQCTIAALQKAFEIENKDIFQAACPLSGGLGATTEGTCGALSGGVMILGYLWGRNKEEFEKGTNDRESQALAKLLYDRFIQEHGSCRCKDIQTKLLGRSFNFWDDEDMEAFEKAGGHRDKCPVVVAKACIWTAKIIWDRIHNTSSEDN